MEYRNRYYQFLVEQLIKNKEAKEGYYRLTNEEARARLGRQKIKRKLHCEILNDMELMGMIKRKNKHWILIEEIKE